MEDEAELVEQSQGEEPHAEHCRHLLRALQSPADTGPSRRSISAGHCRWAGRLPTCAIELAYWPQARARPNRWSG